MPSSQLDVQKRQHRERGQPRKRQRLGLLEKHKDYVQRARDYHSKQDRIKTLQEKASLRNKDEFYFGMVNARTNRGVHIKASGNEALPIDIVKLLKTQDVKYVQQQRSAERQRIGRLQEELNCLIDTDSSSIKGKRTIFTDTPEAVHSNKILRVIRKALAGNAQSTSAEGASLERQAHRERLQAELSARTDRENTLARAERELELQRLLMGTGAKRQILSKRKRKGDLEGRTAGDEGSDEEFRGDISRKTRLPKPAEEEGVATGARKWKAERRR